MDWTLESRLALSHMHGVPHPAMVEVARAQPSPTGVVTKAPNFYELFAGPQRAELDVVRASGRFVPGKGLVFTGTMAGRINRHPSDPSQSSFYAIGINRGSSSAIAPFTNRPNVIFDAVVAVEVQPQGISAILVDLTAPPGTAPTQLPAGSARVNGRQVQVTVDPALLPTPPGGVPLTQFTFNLWPRSSLSMAPLPDGRSVVASFIPEDGMAPIAFPRRFASAFAAPAAASAPVIPMPNVPPTNVMIIPGPVAAPTVASPPTTSTPPPVTAPPVTAPPVTAPPVTAPPVTAPPVTAPPIMY
ncbi:MAG TPA: hypothetical protein VG406_15715 [Isosphaeraceae bacterium]|nr:hypothetical protein [Isosphaeraceae bacterium]